MHEESKSEFSKAVGSSVDTFGQRAVEAGITPEKAAEAAGAAKDSVGSITKAATSGFRGRLGGLASRHAQRRNA